MKRPLFLSLFLLLCSVLPATVYRSNALGHRLEDIGLLTGIGWELESSESEEKLYLDGEIKELKSILPDGYEIEKEDERDRVFLDDSGNIARKVIDKGDSSEEYNYFYSNGRLISYSYSLNGSLVRKVDYNLVGTDLISIDGSSRGFFLKEYYVYEDNGESFIARVSDNSNVDSQYEISEDGRLREEKDGVIYCYSQEGRIAQEVAEDHEKNYFYSPDGDLESIEVINGSRRDVELYKDSRLYNTISYDNDDIIRERRILDSGDIEEIRYMSNTPRYRIILDSNGSRIKEVTAL